MRLKSFLILLFLLSLTGCYKTIVVEKLVPLVPPQELEPVCPELEARNLETTESLFDSYVSDIGVYFICKTGVEQYLLWIKNRKAAMEKENGSSR